MEQKTLTNWVNDVLKDTEYHVKDIKNDFKNGLMLIALLEALTSGRKIRKCKKPPKVKAQMMENLELCINFMKLENVNLSSVGKLYYNIELITASIECMTP